MTGMKIAAGAAALIGLIVLVTIVGLIGGWFSGTAHLVGFDHSSTQVTAVLDDWNNLRVAACNAKDAVSTHQSGDPTLIEDPALSYKAAYRRIQADYDRRMSNFFEAALTRNLPIPSGIASLPRQAPTLTDEEATAC